MSCEKPVNDLARLNPPSVGSLMMRLYIYSMRNFLRSPGSPYVSPLIISRARESRDQRRPTRAANPELFPTRRFSPLPCVCRRLKFFFYSIPRLVVAGERYNAAAQVLVGGAVQKYRGTSEIVSHSRFQIESIAASQQGTRVSIKVERSDYT